MDKNPHFFYALKLPDDIKGLMGRHFGNLKGQFAFKCWVHELDLHITLAFLGSADGKALSASKELVKGALRDISSFNLYIDKLDVFGRQDSPRVFWAGIEDRKELHTLRDKVYIACSQAGFKLETRPFSPHITLARQWTGTNAYRSKEAAEAWKELQPEPIKFQAEEIVLYQTHLDRSPKYEVVELFRLT